MPDETFDDFERLLRDLPKGIGGSIELLLSHLDEGMRLLVRLSAIPHRFNLEILKVLEPKLAEAEIEEQCRRLSELSIVIGVEGTFMLHDEARGYLFSWWLSQRRAESFREVSRRLAEYFQDLAGRQSGIAKVEAELQHIHHLTGANLDAGFQEFGSLCRRERHDFRLANCQALITLMREYDSVLTPQHRAWLDYHEAKLLADRHRWREAQQALESLTAQASGLPELDTRVWFRLGLVHAAQSQWTAAVEAFERAEALARQEPDAADQLDRIYDGLAAAHRGMGKLDRAAELYERSIALAEGVGNAAAMASAHNGLGILHRLRGDTWLAVRAFERSLSLLPSEGSRLRQAQLYNNLGLIHADRTEWETSRQYLERSLDLLKTAGDTVGQAATLTNLMRIYMNLDQQDDAVRVCLQAQDLFLQTHEWRGAATASRSLARYYRRKGNIDMARKEFTQAEQLYIRASHPDRAKAMAEERADLDRRSRPWLWVGVVLGGFVVLIILLVLVGLALE